MFPLHYRKLEGYITAVPKENRHLSWKSLLKILCRLVPVSVYQNNETVKQRLRCLQLCLLEPKHISYGVPGYPVSGDQIGAYSKQSKSYGALLFSKYFPFFLKIRNMLPRKPKISCLYLKSGIQEFH